jgi:hypothetical protein
MGSSPSEAMMITEEQRADTTPCKSALENEQGDDMNRSRLEEGAFGEEEMEVVRPPSRSVSSVRAKMDSPSDLVSAIGKRHADDLAPASMASYADAFNAPTARLTAKRPSTQAGILVPSRSTNPYHVLDDGEENELAGSTSSLPPTSPIRLTSQPIPLQVDPALRNEETGLVYTVDNSSSDRHASSAVQQTEKLTNNSNSQRNANANSSNSQSTNPPMGATKTRNNTNKSASSSNSNHANNRNNSGSRTPSPPGTASRAVPRNSSSSSASGSSPRANSANHSRPPQGPAANKPARPASLFDPTDTSLTWAQVATAGRDGPTSYFSQNPLGTQTASPDEECINFQLVSPRMQNYEEDQEEDQPVFPVGPVPRFPVAEDAVALVISGVHPHWNRPTILTLLQQWEHKLSVVFHPDDVAKVAQGGRLPSIPETNINEAFIIRLATTYTRSQVVWLDYKVPEMNVKYARMQMFDRHICFTTLTRKALRNIEDANSVPVYVRGPAGSMEGCSLDIQRLDVHLQHRGILGKAYMTHVAIPVPTEKGGIRWADQPVARLLISKRSIPAFGSAFQRVVGSLPTAGETHPVLIDDEYFEFFSSKQLVGKHIVAHETLITPTQCLCIKNVPRDISYEAILDALRQQESFAQYMPYLYNDDRAILTRNVVLFLPNATFDTNLGQMTVQLGNMNCDIDIMRQTPRVSAHRENTRYLLKWTSRAQVPDTLQTQSQTNSQNSVSQAPTRMDLDVDASREPGAVASNTVPGNDMGATSTTPNRDVEPIRQMALRKQPITADQQSIKHISALERRVIDNESRLNDIVTTMQAMMIQQQQFINSFSLHLDSLKLLSKLDVRQLGIPEIPQSHLPTNMQAITHNFADPQQRSSSVSTITALQGFASLDLGGPRSSPGVVSSNGSSLLVNSDDGIAAVVSQDGQPLPEKST